MAAGFVLPVESAASSEPQTVPPLPGLWTPGVAKHPAEIGLTHTQVSDRVTDWGLPLAGASSVAAPPDDQFERTGGILSSAVADSEAAPTEAREDSDVPGLTKDEAEARDAYDAVMEARGREIPDGPLTEGDTPQAETPPPAPEPTPEPTPEPEPTPTEPEV